MYDPKCEDLARHFLGDRASAESPRLVAGLAQAIQDEIESWLETERDRLSATINANPN